MADEWNRCEWGDIATLEYGKALRDYRSESGPYRVYGTNGPIGWSDESLCSHGSVIVGRKGAYRGIHYSPEPFFVIDTAFYLEPKKEIDLRWAYYCLLTYDINGMDSGSAIPSTSREAFYKLPVRVPPLKVQQAIAGILGALDDKIELNRRTNKTLEEIAQALFKSWFINFDPVRAKAAGHKPQGLKSEIAALFPSSFENSELGKIPKGWKVAAISDFADVVGGSTPDTKESTYWDGGSHNWATPKDLSALSVPVLLETERCITDQGLAQIGSGLHPAGSILLSSRAPIGYLAINQVPVAVNQGFIVMRPRKGISEHFLLRWAESAHETILSRANGSTFLEISKAAFRPIQLIMPDMEIHLAFDRICRQQFERVVISEKESSTLASLRDVLLPKLISGDLKVPNAERIAGRSL